MKTRPGSPTQAANRNRQALVLAVCCGCALAGPTVARADEELAPLTVTGGPGKGATFTSDDKRFSLNLRGRLQLRNTLAHPAGNTTTDELGVRTARVFLTGNTFDKDLKYFVQLAVAASDFEKEYTSSSPIFDAWVEYTALRDANVRIGQFFVPFDRARTVREFALSLVDRSQVVGELTLDRDAGVVISSSDLGGLDHLLAYQVGVWGGDGKNRVGAVDADLLYTARLTLRPFGAFDDDVQGDLRRHADPKLAVGGGFAYNANTRRARSTTGAVLTLGGIDYVHAAGDVVFKWRGLYFLGEYVYRTARTEQRTGTGANMMPLTEYARSGSGYVFEAGYVLTRALEVNARWSQLFTKASSDPARATDPALVKLRQEGGKELGGGLAYYWNGHALKLVADYNLLFGDGASSRPRHLARVAVDASF